MTAQPDIVTSGAGCTAPLPPAIDMVFVKKDAAVSGLGPDVASCTWRGQTWELAPPSAR